MTSLPGDLRLAFRTLRRSRGFTATVVATLALAVALETSALALVNAFLVRPLPYPGADRLYNVAYAPPNVSHPERLETLDWSSLDDVVEHAIAWDLDMFYLVGDGHPEAAAGAWVTPGYMQGFGIRPVLGRAFLPDEFQTGGPQVALISHALWQGRFGGDSAILGRHFEAYVSDRPDDPEVFTIVGVLPAAFWHLNAFTQVLTPLRAPSYPYYLTVREGVPSSLVQQRVIHLVRGGPATLPPDWRAELRLVHGEYTARVRPVLVAIGASGSLVLLIACANVTLLALIRAMRRDREMAVRQALGAGRGRLARLLLSEGTLLAATGVISGVVLAMVLLHRLAPAIEQQLGRRIPGGPAALAVDGTVLAAVGVLALLITVLLTAGPLLLAVREARLSLMRRGRHGGPGAGGRRVQRSLIAAEVAGSLALVVGAGLMVRTVERLLTVDLGVDSSGIISANVALRERDYGSATELAVFHERFVEALARAPGVTAVALSSSSPLQDVSPQLLQGDGAEGTTGPAGVRTVTPGYFDVLRIPVLDGRAFTTLDDGANEPVAILSEAAARRLWPDGSAIGRIVRIGEPASGRGALPPARRVVGIARDVRSAPTDEQTADVYTPLLQSPTRFAHVLIRAPGTAQQWLGTARAALRDVDQQASLSAARRLDAFVTDQLASPRFLASLLSGFSAFATMLALVGVYGVIAYTVRQREHEIAVRMAVGADRRTILSLFLREGGALVLTGLAAGVLGAVWVGRLLETQLFGVAAMDVTTLVAAAALLGAAALGAIWWPARRASRTDPVLALREE